jgi:hypothetical protein
MHLVFQYRTVVISFFKRDIFILQTRAHYPDLASIWAGETDRHRTIVSQ